MRNSWQIRNETVTSIEQDRFTRDIACVRSQGRRLPVFSIYLCLNIAAGVSVSGTMAVVLRLIYHIHLF
ncbi:hypothetical protein V1956_14540 [Yersinia sp. 2540 StPb PI]|uniref:hypothetical protein n=1 Tax=Yersinia sp. 2540 StPb PI TaxID=3117406 RepID=UPI003FA4ABEB